MMCLTDLSYSRSVFARSGSRNRTGNIFDCRIWLLTLAMLPAVLPAVFAQHNYVLYNMPQVPQAHLLNPGQMPLVKGYFGFPVLSGIRVGGGSSGFTYREFDQSVLTDAYDFDYAGLRDRLHAGTNRMLVDGEVRLLSFGSRVGKGYVNFDVGDVVYFSGNYTSDALDLLYDVQQGNLLAGQIDTTYNQRGLGISGAYYRSYSVSYAHQVLPNLSAGARVRYLQGVAGVWSENQNLMFRYPGDGDSFEVMGQLNVLTAGAGISEEEEGVFATLFPGGNSGFAFDLGGVYQMNDRIELSFSALNLGQINWKKNVNYQVVGDHLDFSAVDIEDHLERWAEVGDSLLNGEPVNPDVRFSTPLPMRFFLGGNYYFRPNTSVGLVINPVRFNGVTDVGVAVSGNTRVGKVLGLSAALGYNRYDPFNLGMGISLDLGILQIYAITDNLLSMFNWDNAHAAQAQLGINFNFGAMRREESSPAPEPVASTAAEEEPLAEDFFFDPAPSPGPEQEAAPSPSPPPVPAPVRTTTPAASRFFTLTGVARDGANGALLQGISVEAYQIGGNGEKVLAYTGSFYNGNLSVPLSRGASYQIIVSRPGFEPGELFLEAARLDPAQAEVQREFVLKKAVEASAPLSVEEKPVEKPLPVEEDVAEEPAPVAPVVESAPPVQAAASLQPGFETYQLTGRTSLRSGPHHTTSVILRFQEGDRVEVLEKTDEWWWKVRYRGQTGYVKAQLLAR